VGESALFCKNVRKTFGRVNALKQVNLSINKGQIVGLVGENGAGKSTILKILAGVHKPDEQGCIVLNGKPYEPNSAIDAFHHGVVTVHQDINLVETMSVAENIFLNNEPAGPFGLLTAMEMNRKAQDLIDHYKIEVDASLQVGRLPNDLKKMVQIVKAMTWNPSILLLDEPTSSLTAMEVDVVLDLVQDLAKRGIAIVFVSHYLSEVFKICDQISVMRDGQTVALFDKDETNVEEVVTQMLGHKLVKAEARSTRHTAEKNDVLMSVKGLEVPGLLHDISFDLHRGEILGFTGLTGSGLTELAKTLFGVEEFKPSAGTISVEGKPQAHRTPGSSLKEGMALLTSDRLREGILPEFSLTDNITLPILKDFKNGMGLLSRTKLSLLGESFVKKLRVVAPSADVPIRTLSGGNQQKVLIAKWLATKPKIFMLDDPTVGIDVGSKDEIRQIIEQIAAEGVGVTIFTTEIQDIEQLCDRAFVMFRGSIVGEFKGESLEHSRILQTSVSGRATA
jgi:ABC-type sugar transport system ATPase subunit